MQIFQTYFRCPSVFYSLVFMYYLVLEELVLNFSFSICKYRVAHEMSYH